MKDIMKKLAELEATAPKVSKKKMLKEDSTTPPIDVSNKPASLKDVFESIAGQKPIPVVGKEGGQQQTGAGFVNVTDPALQGLGKTIGDLAAQKKIQLVVPTQPGQAPQAGQTQQPGQTQQSGQPNQAGATGQPQAGQQPMREKWGTDTKVSPSEKGKYAGKDKAELTKAYNKLKASGPHKKGSPEFGKMRELAFAIRAKSDWGKVQEEEQLDELSPEAYRNYIDKAVRSKAQASDDIGAHRGAMVKTTRGSGNIPGDKSPAAKAKADAAQKTHDKRYRGIDMAVRGLGKEEQLDEKFASQQQAKLMYATAGGADTGVSKKVAKEFIKKSHGQKVSKLPKKKTDEADIPSTNGIDTQGAGLGAGRSMTTLEAKEPQVEVIDNAFNRENYKDLIGKKYPKSKAPAYARVKEISEGAKPDFLDLDKDGNKKESMKKAAADKKKQKVKESMNHRISAARLEGKSHGLRGHAHSGKRYEDLEELKAYHEGYKEGLDECYGQGVYEAAPAMPAATLHGMADDAMEEGKFKDAALGLGAFATAMGTGAGVHKLSQMGHPDRPAVSTTAPAAAKPAVSLTKGGVTKINPVNKFSEPTRLDNLSNPHSKVTRIDPVNKRSIPTRVDLEELDMEEGNLFTGNLAKARASGAKSFDLDGDGDMEKVKETAFAFEAWDRELQTLLNEGEEVNEGLSVSVSKGQQNSPDSVTITAQDAEADQLLQLVKHAGLGLFGDEAAHEPSSAMSIQPSHGEPDEVGAGGVDVEVVDGHDGIMGLMQKLSGIQADGEGDEDYADEEGHKDCGCEGDCDCNEKTDESTCNECGGMGMHESGCSMDKGKEMVDEVETEDQMEFEVAEDNAPDSETAEHDADEDAEAQEDAALAQAAQQNKTNTVNEGGDGGEASEEGTESKEGETDEEGETVSESFINLFKKLEMIAEESTEKEDEKAEKAGKKVTKDIEYDDKKDKEDKKEKVDEWANQVGKGPGKGTDASFEQDIDFMTKVIAGGLNKPKSTGQTTIPVIAGQDDRMHDNPQDWATLAGIKK